MRSANLTTNAKASGRKLTLLIIKDLEKDREPWMADVVRKSELLGQHDTINMKWIPQNQDYQVKITGVVSAKSQPDPSKGRARPLTPALLEMSEWTAPPALLGVGK